MRAWLLLFALLATFSGCSCRDRLFCKQVGEQCTSHDQCCSFGCGDLLQQTPGVCACNPLPGGVCSTSADCCSGLRCNQGSCEQGCRPADDACRSPSDCCSGTCTDGKCAPRVGCADQGQTCSSSNDCCPGLQCPGGTCQPAPCKTASSTCAASSECCSGLGCPAGTCITGCRTSGSTCVQDNDCCSGGSAGAMHCRGNPDSGTAPECYSGCGQTGSPCAQNGDCCTNLRCGSNGACRLGSLGDSCTITAECQNPYVCNPVDNRCHFATCQAVNLDCASGLDCCSMSCEPVQADGGGPTTCCQQTGGSCYTLGNDCCGTDVCLTGLNGGANQCGPCKGTGVACGFYSDCCGQLCGGGVCQAGPGGACDAGNQCYQGSCESGACCRPLTYTCAPGDPCCSGGVCNGGTCCTPEGAACSSFTCCSGDTCEGGSCCRFNNQACTSGGQCCSGDCDGGSCQCALPGEACRVTNDCCSGGFPTCAPATDGGIFGHCCLPTNAACTPGAAGACCNGACKGNGVCP